MANRREFTHLNGIGKPIDRWEVAEVRLFDPFTTAGFNVARRKQPPTFEASLSELEMLVDGMESGDLPLEEALKSFERGVELTRQCQQQLKEAEQKVQILTEKSLGAELEPFENNE